MDAKLKTKLISAATKYDELQAKRAAKNPRANHNPFALGIYFGRIDDIERDIDAGAEPAAAISAGFSGTLRNAILKGAGFEKNEIENGGWVYKPVKAKGE